MNNHQHLLLYIKVMVLFAFILNCKLSIGYLYLDCDRKDLRIWQVLVLLLLMII